MRWPEIAQHLEKIPYFVAIAKAGSLQRAARELRIAQPSLTKSMQHLEAALQVTLFNRSRKGVTLTAAGDEFRRFAEPLLHSLAAVERQVRDVAGDAGAGEMRLGTHELLVREFWPPLVRKLKKTSPRLNLTLFTNPSVGELTRRLLAGELDLIIAVECSPNTTLDRREIRADHYSPYATREFLKSANLSATSKLSLKDLNSLPLIYATEVIAGPGIKLGSALRAGGVDQPSLYAVHSLESVASLAESGLGIGFLPSNTVKADKQSRLIELKTPALAGGRLGVHRLYAMTTATQAKEPRVRAVIDEVDHLLH